MHKVKLYTYRYVMQLNLDGTETRVREPAGYVATVEMPPMVIPPEVLQWGERTFTYYATDAAGQLSYVEACLWVAIVAFVEHGTAETA